MSARSAFRLSIAIAVCALSTVTASSDDPDAKFASPDATFGTAKDALKRDDYKAFCQCFTEDGLSLLAGTLRLTSGFIEYAGQQPGASASQSALAKELAQIKRRHLKNGDEANINLDLNAAEAELCAAIRKLAEPIDDRAGYVADVLKTLQSSGDARQGVPFLSDGKLEELKVDGDTATAVLDGTFLEPRKSTNRILFVATDGAWRIQQLGTYGVTNARAEPAPRNRTVRPRIEVAPSPPARNAESAPRTTPPRPARPAATTTTLPDASKLAPIDRPDEEGFAKLHRVAIGGKVEDLQSLLDQGAEVNVRHRTFHGTPLQYAASNGKVDAVKWLLDHEATVDAADTHGRTPLMWAAWRGHADVVEVLLDGGANVDQQNREGWTALHFAADKGKIEAAKLLIRRGASLTVRTSQGKTPLDINPGIAPRD